MSETRIVACTRCGEQKAGLAEPPLAGELGQQLLANVCQDCWNAWFEQSVLVINHYGLNPAIREQRLQLYDAMKEFLGLAGRTPA